MAEIVTSYHPTVGRTSTEVDGLIQGTACFPGGSGLWRGRESGGPLPDRFPDRAVMFVGHNFDSQRGYEASFRRGGEAEGDFWTRLLRVLEAAGLAPQECFFTNALMGLKPGKAEGKMPSVPGYHEQCRRFLLRQVEIVAPRAVVALGVRSSAYVRGLSGSTLSLRHPGAWCFRPLATRDSLLAEEGRRLAEFLGLTAIPSLQAGWALEVPQHPAQSEAPGRSSVTISPSGGRGGTDAWGFRAGTRNAFLIDALEQGGKTKEEIRRAFLEQFPDSAGKSTFNVFFTDLVRPFGAASVSRCMRIESDSDDRLSLHPERAMQVKKAVAAGILDEINSLKGAFPKKDSRAIDEIVERYRAPRG